MKHIKLFVLLVFLGSPLTAFGQFSLWLTESAVELKYPLPQVHYEELKKNLSTAPADILIFDTRTQKEYQTSHIQSSLQVDPEMSEKEFFEKMGEKIKGKTLIFYCSVGYRSSIFAERVQQKAMELGAQTVTNLRGGIFRWYNENNPVYNQSGITDDIHPFDEEWGTLLEFRNK